MGIPRVAGVHCPRGARGRRHRTDPEAAEGSLLQLLDNETVEPGIVEAKDFNLRVRGPEVFRLIFSYIQVSDLAEAHIKALRALLDGDGS